MIFSWRLFHTDPSESHVRLETGRVVGLTDVGRTTVFLLEMNADQRIDLRLVNQ
jgi:hypothetical protein